MRRRWSLALGVLVLAAAVDAGCGRTPALRPARQRAPIERDADVAADAPGADADVDGAPDVREVGGERPSLLPDAGPGCIAQPEVCNGRDDDCDGMVDDGIAAVPCPLGGQRYCVAGVFSECPKRCEACVPGSSRVCFVAFCTFWGVQPCASDGRSFGACQESPVPSVCEAVAKANKRSRQLEQCCLDNGYCCRDDFDLDGDGNADEMIGNCAGVMCTP